MKSYRGFEIAPPNLSLSGPLKWRDCSKLRFIRLVALLLFGGLINVQAQGDSITISAAEFQRMTYSAHLLAQLDEKPELEPCLRVLLEVDRRNPNADPALLANVLGEATARYRAITPAYVRTGGSRDEILAAYLDAFRQVPGRTNFVSVQLNLLNHLITRDPGPSGEPQADMIHSGSRSVLGAVGDLAERQALLDACIARAGNNSGFRAAMDSVLVPETFIPVAASPAQIIANTNSPLHGNTTMQALLAWSTNGALTVSSNQLMALFAGETRTVWDTINTNLSLQREISFNQRDLLAYLTNQAAINSDAQRLAEVKRDQLRTIASASAAVLVQSKLMAARDPLIKLPGQMQGYMDGLHKITDGVAAFAEKDATKLGRIAASGNVISGAMGIFDMLFGGESPEEEIVREIGNIKTLLADLSSNMNYRFDRVDQSLTQIYSSLNERFDQIEITLDAQGRQIAHLNGDVDEIRLALLDAQTELFRIERNLATFQALDWRMNLVDQIKLARGFEARVTSPMEYTGNAPADFVSFESVFSTYAVDRASAETLSRCATLPFGDQFLYEQLAVGGGTNVYAETLNYVKKYLRGMGLTEFSEQPVLVNPQDWSTGAGAWLQLAVENPGHFRKYESDAGSPGRLDGIISKGRALTNFFGKLTFNGTNINWPVYAALENHYFRKLTNFTGQVRSVEQQVATERGFAIDRWRQWAASAPPSIHVTATKVSASPAMILPPATVWATQIVAGGNHNLALRSDGTIIAWGNHAEGATRIPPGLTNMLAVGAGQSHSLAIKPDHTVIAWGLNNYNQTNVPANVINVIAVSAGHFHSLALRADGTVVGWGAGTSVGAFPHFGQAQPPLDATNITALAGGGYHSLALRTDGTLLAWGLNNEGQLNIPADATNIVAIAGGHGHNMALRSNGTVVVWGNNLFNGVPVGITTIPAEATNIVAIAAAGWHCLALRSDGKVLAWGANDGRQCIVPPGLCDVQSLSAGLAHSVALKTDGSVVVWGNNDHRECLVPPSLTRQGALSEGGVHFLGLRTDGTVADYGFVADYANPVPPAEATNVVAIAAGAWHSLFLRADGTVVPDGWYAENGVPAGLTNIIGVAAGGDHSMVLRNDGRIICWGKDEYGQTNVPVGLSNVVAVAAGYYHNLALKANGTVVAWGDNTFGQTNVPAGLSNVVMISAGYSHNLALRSDGSIVGWGTNDYGQISIPPTATNVIAMVAGGSHSMVLRADGTMVAWGFNGDGISSMPASLTNVVAIAPGLALGNDGVVTGWGGAFYGHNPPENESSLVAISCGRSYNLGLRADGTVAMWSGTHSDQTNVPAGLSNVIAIAAGDSHNLALRRDGTVVAWGGNYYGITNVPASATNVVSIAAGTSHCLALRKDGKVVAWGYNYFGQTNVPTGLSNVVMIAAGSSHSLALRADCTVVAWGDGSGGGQPPASVTNVIAIAAGGLHNAALRSDGSVVCWGHSYYGANVAPADATNVVAIAAGGDHCIALRADGSLIAWGKGFHGQTIIPRGATNVFAIAGGIDDHSLFLSASGNGTQPASDNTFAVRTQIPNQVGHLFQTINRSVLTNLNFDLHGVATEVSGSKALLTAVLELGLPYTLERDDVLRGFLYGSESLAGLEEARGFLQSENARLDAAPGSAPQTLMDISMLRYLRFGERLEQRLNDLAATGQPEIPRLVGHTLRLLNLLRDSWNTTPPSALEIDRGTNAPGIVLYGEPYAHYALQYSDALGVPAWVSGSGTNVHNEQRIVLPVPSGQQRFYRAVLPIP